MSDERESDHRRGRAFSAYAKEFHAYYHERAEFGERLSLWHDLLNKYIVPGGLPIDMGCGTGVFGFYLAERAGRVVGVDGASGMVQFCEEQRRDRGLENVRFTQARLPDIDETGLSNADLLISSSVVEYVDDFDSCVNVFARLLKPGAVRSCRCRICSRSPGRTSGSGAT